jgi:hypothetical protein
MRKLIAIAALSLALLLAPAAAYADGIGGVDCSEGNNSQSAICNPQTSGDTNPISGEDGILLKATKLIAYISGAAAIIIILVGSIQFITAGGDANKAAGARRTVLNAAIGLVVIVAAASLITFVVHRI